MPMKCFKCGSSDRALVSKSDSDTGKYWVGCDRCGAMFPPGSSPEEAVLNVRRLQPEYAMAALKVFEELAGYLGEMTRPTKPLQDNLGNLRRVINKGYQDEPELYLLVCNRHINILPRITVA